MSKVFDIPGQYVERFMNNYEMDLFRVMSEDECIKQFSLTLPSRGIPKVVWDGKEKMEAEDQAVVYLAHETCLICTIKVRRAVMFKPANRVEH